MRLASLPQGSPSRASARRRREGRARRARILPPLLAASFLALLPGSPSSALDKTEDAQTIEGPVVVFVYPAPSLPSPPKAAPDPKEQELHAVEARITPELESRKLRVISVRNGVLRFGAHPGKRRRQVDFRKTQGFLGTVLFAEDHEPQIHVGLETEAQLLARVDAYFKGGKRK